MRFSRDGLTHWCGTPDAPAPEGVVPAGVPTPVMLGVHPPSPDHQAAVRYVVNDGAEQLAHAVRQHGPDGADYFVAELPPLSPGDRVRYAPAVGRDRPPPGGAAPLHGHYTVGDARDVGRAQAASPATPSRPAPHATPATVPAFVKQLDFLARMEVTLRPPEAIGETPEGLRLNWYLAGGRCYGPKLNATVRAEGGDWMVVRPDGIGIVDLRATLQTHDGALLLAMYQGVCDFGEDGYQAALTGNLPPTPPISMAPRFISSDARYRWLNRLQCSAFGQVVIAERLVRYDLYAAIAGQPKE